MQESWTGPVDAPLQCLVWIPPCPWILTYSGVRPKLLLHEKKMITRAVDRGSWSGSSSQSCMSEYLGSSGMGWWPGIEVYGRELLQSLASTSNTPPPTQNCHLICPSGILLRRLQLATPFAYGAQLDNTDEVSVAVAVVANITILYWFLLIKSVRV